MEILAKFFNYDTEITSTDKDEFIELLEKEIKSELLPEFNIKTSVKYADIFWNDYEDTWQIRDNIEFNFEGSEEEFKKYFFYIENMSFTNPEIRFNNNIVETKNELNPEWSELTYDCSEYKII